MYWKIGQKTAEGWEIYNYFCIITKSFISFKPYYNPFVKQMIYPATKDIIIKALAAATDEDFESWYRSANPLNVVQRLE